MLVGLDDQVAAIAGHVAERGLRKAGAEWLHPLRDEDVGSIDQVGVDALRVQDERILFAVVKENWLCSCIAGETNDHTVDCSRARGFGGPRKRPVGECDTPSGSEDGSEEQWDRIALRDGVR